MKQFLSVIKPGIVLANAISTAGGFFLASRGRPEAAALPAILLGTCLVVASGCVFNNIIDRDLDRKMTRTRDRVLARGVMSPHLALFYASLLGLVGTVILAAGVNRLAVCVVLAGWAIYVGPYSLFLKRRSRLATLIGSLAGAAPPLAGYCAASGRLDWGALIVFSIFCLWQIPHAYAVAIFRHDDYTAAALPLRPLQRGLYTAKKQMAAYLIVFVAATSMLTLGGYTGIRYLLVVVTLSIGWLVIILSNDAPRRPQRWGHRLLVFSIVTIVVLNVMIAVDATAPATAALFLTYAP